MAQVTVNRNEQPLRSVKELDGSQRWADYFDRERFVHLCTLAPDNDRERLEVAAVHDEEGMKREGLVYAMVVDGRIFKIGQSINTFKNRLGSYNTGKMSYRSRSTNSGANFFILQSLLLFNEAVEIYAFFPPHRRWRLFGRTGHEAFPSTKVAERALLDRYAKRYGAKPIGCSQG